MERIRHSESGRVQDLQQILEQSLDTPADEARAGAVAWRMGVRELAIVLMVAVHGQLRVERWRESFAVGLYWPVEFGAIQLLWLGRPAPYGGDADRSLLHLGPLQECGLALEVLTRIVWQRGAPVWAELPDGGTPTLKILEPARVRAEHLVLAWRSLELVGRVEANRGRVGRKAGHLVGVTREAFIETYLRLLRQSRRRPRQVDLARALAADESTVRRFMDEHGLKWPPI